jgi:antitoxin ParD1/3/4
MGVEKVSVALTEELAEEVREAVRTGDYASVSEVVREAVRTWMERRADTALLKRLVEDGLASGEAVEREPIEAFLKRVRERLEKTRAA